MGSLYCSPDTLVGWGGNNPIAVPIPHRIIPQRGVGVEHKKIINIQTVCQLRVLLDTFTHLSVKFKYNMFVEYLI